MLELIKFTDNPVFVKLKFEIGSVRAIVIALLIILLAVTQLIDEVKTQVTISL